MIREYEAAPWFLTFSQTGSQLAINNIIRAVKLDSDTAKQDNATDKA